MVSLVGRELGRLCTGLELVLLLWVVLAGPIVATVAFGYVLQLVEGPP